MREKAAVRLQIFRSYIDVVLQTNNCELYRRYFKALGYLEAYRDCNNYYDELDPVIKDELHELYEELSHREHQQQPAGRND